MGTLANVPLVSPEQVNLLKVYEVDLAAPTRLDVPRAVMESAFERFAGQAGVPTTREAKDALLRKPAPQQLEMLFRVRARDLYSRVRVIDPPEAVRAFRTDVSRGWLINACATSACHGGEAAGRFVLSARRASGDASLLTNMYILERFRTASGQSLIDLENPERSPLLHLGLPRESSLFRHPVVNTASPTPPPVDAPSPGHTRNDAWRPIFKSAEDPRFVATVAWIKQLYRPRPDPAITYTPLRPFEPPVSPPAPPPVGPAQQGADPSKPAQLAPPGR